MFYAQFSAVPAAQALQLPHQSERLITITPAPLSTAAQRKPSFTKVEESQDGIYNAFARAQNAGAASSNNTDPFENLTQATRKNLIEEVHKQVNASL